MGKENVFSIDYYHARGDRLVITDDREQYINHIVGTGKPCNISFLHHDGTEYREECYNNCSLDGYNEIVFETYTSYKSTR